MCQFIETIRIDSGEARNLTYHEQRLNDTRNHFWPGSHALQLADFLPPRSRKRHTQVTYRLRSRRHRRCDLHALSPPPRPFTGIDTGRRNRLHLQKHRPPSPRPIVCTARLLRRHTDCPPASAHRHQHCQHRPFLTANTGTLPQSPPAERDQTCRTVRQRNPL